MCVTRTVVLTWRSMASRIHIIVKRIVQQQTPPLQPLPQLLLRLPPRSPQLFRQCQTQMWLNAKRRLGIIILPWICLAHTGKYYSILRRVFEVKNSLLCLTLMFLGFLPLSYKQHKLRWSPSSVGWYKLYAWLWRKLLRGILSRSPRLRSSERLFLRLLFQGKWIWFFCGTLSRGLFYDDNYYSSSYVWQLFKVLASSQGWINDVVSKYGTALRIYFRQHETQYSDLTYIISFILARMTWTTWKNGVQWIIVYSHNGFTSLLKIAALDILGSTLLTPNSWSLVRK